MTILFCKGNEALYHLTLSGGNEVLILMQTWDGVWKHAYYIGLYIGHKNDNYRLYLSEYSGSAVTVCKTVTPNTQAKNCSEVQSQGHSCSGVYTIYPSVNIQKDVWCDLQTIEGRWTVFQQRKDGSVDFNRTWSDYEHGFGDPNTEYWIGNEALYQLTLSGGNELLILMQTWDGVWKYAHYTDFYIGPKNDNYRLHFSEYSGSAGNSLFIQEGYQFSTLDTDNDGSDGSCNPKYHKGGFWFNDCGSSDLNGYYYPSGIISDDSCHWWTFTEYRESLKTIYMMVR
ncbi:angiopoietin 4 [Mytilus galloprovincialis]|uniref:Angiopoietin 4 n=1 Tax=Mytilus galloprovincialis TaxID=29158 RepID=A0A8B6EHS9_MYTGA|nr:angiopoietin 4 [Mytilus galloprovincialis]